MQLTLSGFHSSKTNPAQIFKLLLPLGLLLFSAMRKIKSRFQRRGSRQVRPPEQREEVRSETLNGAGAVTRLTMVDPIPVPTPVPTNRPTYVLALPAPPRNGNVVLPNGTHNIVDEEINMEEANRIIDRFRGGELQCLIDWYEEVQARFDEMMREIESRRRSDT